jgi:hypothetical protein
MQTSKMDQHQRGRNIQTLWTPVLLGTAYSSWLYYEGTLIGGNNVDGIISHLYANYLV